MSSFYSDLYIDGRLSIGQFGSGTLVNGLFIDSSGFVTTGTTISNSGMFAQTADSVTVSATTAEISILGSGVGTLTVPANTFQVGDSFHCKIGGKLSAVNAETLNIKIKGSVVLAEFQIEFNTSNWPAFWELEVDFTIRAIGVKGVIQTNSNFNYDASGGGGTYEGSGYNTNTTIDTTSNNTLDITVEWGSNNAGNAILSDIFYLHKVY